MLVLVFLHMFLANASLDRKFRPKSSSASVSETRYRWPAARKLPLRKVTFCSGFGISGAFQKVLGNNVPKRLLPRWLARGSALPLLEQPKNGQKVRL